MENMITSTDLVKQMHEARLVTDGIGLSPSTAYRFLHRRELMAKQPVRVDRRKFDADRPNDLWQSAVMHGPFLFAGDKRRKTYLIAFIDDHSRIITHAHFYLSEGMACFMTAFAEALLRRGLPRRLNVHNGLAFPLPPTGVHCGSLGDRAGSRPPVSAASQRQNRDVFQKYPYPLPPLLQRGDAGRDQRGPGSLAERGVPLKVARLNG